MTHPHRSPSLLLASFQALFADIPGFVENKEDTIPKRIRFVKDCPEKSLRIVVTTPIKMSQSGLSSPILPELISGMRIFFTIRHYDNKRHFDFRASRITNTDAWADVTSRKARTLVELVDGINMCPKCIDQYPFPVVDTAPQGRPKSTRFVWCECLTCHRKDETEYGTGLKTAISRYLPKRK